MGFAGGKFGYRLQLITHKDSNIVKVSDMKGRKIAHVTPSSNSGNQAPRALFKSLGVEPDVDYKVIYSGKHDNSIMGVANKDYDAASIQNTNGTVYTEESLKGLKVKKKKKKKKKTSG